MKAKYKLSTGLSEIVEQPMFDTDREAWEYLRKKYSAGKFATLYRQEEVIVPVVNKNLFLRFFNRKYTSQKKVEGKPNYHTYWKPVLEGITSHSYRAIKYIW